MIEGAACRAARRVDVPIWLLIIIVTAIGLSAKPAAAEMTFRIVSMGDTQTCGANCAQLISVQGEITENSAEAFIDFLEQNTGKKHLRGVVLLHSPGGNVLGAMKLGHVLRKLGAAVVIARADSAQSLAGSSGRFAPGRCMSACVYVLMGGAKRVVPDPSEVGIHRMFRQEAGKDPAGGVASYRRMFASGNIVGALRKYSGVMGVSPSLVDFAEKVSPDAIHIVSPAELTRWRLGSRNF